MKLKIVYEDQKFHIHRILFNRFNFQLCRPLIEDGNPLVFVDMKVAIGFLQMKEAE